MKLYAIVDRKAKSVVSTFQSLNDEAAKRSFLSLISSPIPNVFTEFPEDFILYPLCELSYNNSLVVSAHNLEDLKANGFNVMSFTVSEPIDNGADYNKQYLKMLRFDREKAFDDSPEGEVSD